MTNHAFINLKSTVKRPYVFTNRDLRMQEKLIGVHFPLSPQTIFRGPDEGLYPCLHDSTNSAPGLKYLCIPSISMLSSSAGLKHTARTGCLCKCVLQIMAFSKGKD